MPFDMQIYLQLNELQQPSRRLHIETFRDTHCVLYIILQNITSFCYFLQEAVNGTNAGIEKTDAEKNGGEKWRKNYVPYEEE